MHAALVEAENLLEIELPSLRKASDRTAERVSVARNAVDRYLTQHLGDDRNLDTEPIVTAFGSMAREEMAPGSDFDYLVILRTLEKDPAKIQLYRESAIVALEQLGLDPPGGSGLFGCAISGTDLVNTIGLDTDTNLHLSRRILLLEESIGLNAEAHHGELIATIAARYLHQNRLDQPYVPHFLLNDVLRYWRTVAVDYEAKRWDELRGRKWGLRYVKLLSSRKLVVAGTVVSLFWPVITGTPTTPDVLRSQFAMPAMARLGQLARVLGTDTQEHLRSVLVLADRFNGWLADAEIRREYERWSDPASAAPDSAMHEALEDAKKLQCSLEAIFFSEEPLNGRNDLCLAKLSKRYLSF